MRYAPFASLFLAPMALAAPAMTSDMITTRALELSNILGNDRYSPPVWEEVPSAEGGPALIPVQRLTSGTGFPDYAYDPAEFKPAPPPPPPQSQGEGGAAVPVPDFHTYIPVDKTGTPVTPRPHEATSLDDTDTGIKSVEGLLSSVAGLGHGHGHAKRQWSHYEEDLSVRQWSGAPELNDDNDEPHW